MTANETHSADQEINRSDWLYSVGSLPIVLASVQLLRTDQMVVALGLFVGTSLVLYARSVQETHRAPPKIHLYIFAAIVGIQIVLHLVGALN